MVAVAIDSKDNLLALQRNAAGKPQLFKFGPNQGKSSDLTMDSNSNIYPADTVAPRITKSTPSDHVFTPAATQQ